MNNFPTPISTTDLRRPSTPPQRGEASNTSAHPPAPTVYSTASLNTTVGVTPRPTTRSNFENTSNPYEGAATAAVPQRESQPRHFIPVNAAAETRQATINTEMEKIKALLLNLDEHKARLAYKFKLLHYLSNGQHDVSYNVSQKVQEGRLTLQDVRYMLDLPPEDQTKEDAALEQIILKPLSQLPSLNIEKGIKSGFLQRTQGNLQLAPIITQQIQDGDFEMLIHLYKLVLNLQKDDPKVLWANQIANKGLPWELKLGHSTPPKDSIAYCSERIINILLGKENPPSFISNISH